MANYFSFFLLLLLPYSFLFRPTVFPPFAHVSANPLLAEAKKRALADFLWLLFFPHDLLASDKSVVNNYHCITTPFPECFPAFLTSSQLKLEPFG